MEPMTYLDMKTIAILGLVLPTTLALIMFQTSLTRKTYPGFWSWTAGQACWVLAITTFFARPIIGEAWSVVLCNPMFFLFGMLMHDGLARFHAIENRRRLMTADAVASATGLVLIYGHLFVVRDTNARVLLSSLVMSFILLRAGWEPLRIPHVRRSAAQVGISLSLWLVAGLMVIRAVAAMAGWSRPNELMQDPMLKAVLVSGLFAMVIAVYGFISLMHVRLEGELRDVQAILKEQADTDPLTGVMNRRGFREIAAHDVMLARRYGYRTSLIMFDLDYFKRINDTHGHAVGDEVLAEVARLCLEEVRAVDTVARLGGEEFVVLMPQASLENARLAAERLRRRLKRTWKVAGAAVATSASFGVAELGGGGFEAMMRCADSRLYRAKREGRDRVCADGEFRDLEEGRTVQA